MAARSVLRLEVFFPWKPPWGGLEFALPQGSLGNKGHRSLQSPRFHHSDNVTKGKRLWEVPVTADDNSFLFLTWPSVGCLSTAAWQTSPPTLLSEGRAKFQ